MQEKKKIGIVTIPSISNYGNKLQNYAVQTILEGLGYEAETIIDLRYRKNPVSWKTYYKDIIHYITHIRYKPNEHKKNLTSYFWSKRYIKWSPIYITDIANEKKLNERYDGFVVGSDQIWGPYCPWDSSELAFLTFAEPNKRIAFAPSFGTDDFPPERRAEYVEWLNGFKRLSVREERGAQIISELIQREAEVLVDPTMVLSVSEWDKIAKATVTGRYILVYMLGDITDENRAYLNELRVNTQYKIVDIMHDEAYAGSDPGEFVGLIKNATYVVTDSFHGCVFSILYHRPFTLFRREGHGNSMFSRLEQLMALFKLITQKRNTSQREDVYEFKIDRDMADDILERERYKSIQYLKQSLEMLSV